MSSGFGPIRPLPPEVATKINSSTTVPSLNSVVLGLVQNSLDARAQRLDIEVDYGHGSCTVEDDGSGIPPSEFAENGGLAKAHHSSKANSEDVAHGCNGTFLSSVAALSILTITSHFFQNRSYATVTLHHSRPAARLVPAPMSYQLSCREHGTRVSVRDLFGNMPVRVKQRSLDLKNPRQEGKYLEALKEQIVGVLLAWGNPITVKLRTASGLKVLHIRATENWISNISKRPSSVAAFDVQAVRSVLSQARHIEPSDWNTWVPTSARSASVIIEGAISLQPAPSKRTQFISLGINYIDKSSGYSILYDEINRLFATSSFGFGYETSDSEEPDAKKRDRRHKTDGLTGKQLRGGGKGIDQWPMYSLRIVVKGTEDLRSEGFRNGFQARIILSTTIKVLEAMVVDFLETNHFLPRRKSQGIKCYNSREDVRTPADESLSRIPSPSSGQQEGQKLASDQGKKPSFSKTNAPSSDSNSRIRSTPSSLHRSALANTKMPKFQSPRYRFDAGPFGAWSRIKSGNREYLRELYEHKSTSQDAMEQRSQRLSVKESSNASRSLQGCSSNQGAPNAVPIDHHQATDVPLEEINCNDESDALSSSRSGTSCSDSTITWMNPISKATVLINARTGLVIPQRSKSGVARTLLRSKAIGAPSQRGRPALSICDLSAAPQKVSWARNIVESWENPTFSRVEEKIPQISLNMFNFDTYKILHGRDHQCSRTDIDKAFAESASSTLAKLSKHNLSSARVIAQVDKKYILVCIKDAIEEGNGKQDPANQKKTLVLIDQHAADERIRIEKLFAEICMLSSPQDQAQCCGLSHGGLSPTTMTSVLTKPIIFETTGHEWQLFVDHASHFAAWGILYELDPSRLPSAFTSSQKCKVTVKILPEIIAERCRVDPKILIGILRSEVWEREGSGHEEVSGGREHRADGWLSRIGGCPQGIVDMLISRSCRSAIMFNDELSIEQFTPSGNATARGKLGPAQYLVYPANEAEVIKLQAYIQAVFDPQSVKAFRDYRSAIRFWLIVMTVMEFAKFTEKYPYVHIYENSKAIAPQEVIQSSIDRSFDNNSSEMGRLDKSLDPDLMSFTPSSVNASAMSLPDSTVLCQTDAPNDLKVVSWPRSRMFSTNPRCYKFDGRGGRHAVIYVIENGIANSPPTQVPEFIHGRVTWLYGAPGGFQDPTLPLPRDDHPRSHVVVKSSEYIADMEWAFLEVERDMRRHPGRRAVIVFASASRSTYGPTTPIPFPWLSIRKTMKAIVDLNGIIVTSSGNAGTGRSRRNVDTLPALFNGPDLPLVVTGAVDNFGTLASFSQGPGHVDIWAPGVAVSCTRPSLAQQMGTGTSHAAGLVAGLACYFLGFANPPFAVGAGRTAQNFKDFLKDKASWRRHPLVGPNVIWNRENGFKTLAWDSHISLPSNVSVS